jgi:hypothetical protein
MTKSSFDAMRPFLTAENASKATGITHPKFLCLLSALRNKQATPAEKDKLLKKNEKAWSDIHYRRLARAAGITSFK